MTTINAKFIEQLELIEPDLKDTEADFKWASSSVKKDQFRIDKNNASKIVLRVGRAMLAIKNTKQNLELYKDALKKADRTFPAGAYKRGGMGRKYPKFSSGMTTAEYCIKFQALNNDVGAHVLPIDFDALGDRPAALYENGALDFDATEESIEAIEVENEELKPLGQRFDEERAKRKAAREAIAAKDVAQVVAHAVAAVAISEAMQPSEAPILSTLDQFLAAQKEKMTCIRYAQTSRVMHSRVRYDEEVMKAHSWIELLIQSEGRKTTNKQENKLQDMTRLQSHRANNEEQQAHEKRVKLAGTKTVYYAQNEAGSMVELSFTEYLYAQFLEAMQPSEALELATCEAGADDQQATTYINGNKAAYTGETSQAHGATWHHVTYLEGSKSGHGAVTMRAPDGTGLPENAPKNSGIVTPQIVPASPVVDAVQNQDAATETPPGEAETPAPSTTPGVEGVARSNLETEDEKRKQWQGFAHDIPASLAISAYNGVSMSPERRGASAQNEYGQTMAADYETMRAQATKGGTLDLLPEVFARYRSRQSSAYKAYLASSSRCVSSFIAGPANFPAARMNKRSEIAHKRLGEYLNGGEMALQAACRTLRPDLRAIMAGDVDAIDRLTVDISSAERTQDQMKAANKAIRTNANAGEAHQVAALMELGHSEAQALELLHPRFSRGQGFPSYRLTNNQANIRRMRERLEKITAAKARPVETVECSNGVTLEDDAPANRVRLFFPGKPSDEIRADLKSNGFRWAPSVGAWQAYRNRGTLSTAKRLAGEVVESAPILPEEIQGGMGGSPVQIENDDPAIEAPTIAQEIAAIDAPIVATVDAQTTPDTLESFDIDGDGVSDELCEAIDKATAQQVQALTDAQFSKLYDHLENWNFHTENYMLEALRLGDVPIIDDMRQITIDQKNAGYLRGDINNRRIVITDRMKALKEAQDAPQVQQASEVVEPVQDAPQPKPRPTVRSKSGKWNAVFFRDFDGKFCMIFETLDAQWDAMAFTSDRSRMQALTDLGRAADSLPPNPPKKPEGWEGSPVQFSNTPEDFKMAGPVRVDLAALIAQGVKPEALVGLGVYYRGDMANPSDSGAITGFSHSDFYGLVFDVALESGIVWRANRTSEFKDGSFSIDGKMHGAPYMAQLSATVATLKASASSAAEQAAKAHATALIDLAAQFPQLKRAENTYAGGKLAAVNARILLKAAFKGVKFSVKSDCNSMRLEWADGPTDAQVCEVVGRFDIGEFDAYTDYHSTSSTAFSQLFGGVQYMTTRRTESDELVQMAIDQAFADAADKPTLNDWHKGTNDMGWGDWKRRWVSDALKTISLFSTTKSHTKA